MIYQEDDALSSVTYTSDDYIYQNSFLTEDGTYFLLYNADIGNMTGRTDISGDFETDLYTEIAPKDATDFYSANYLKAYDVVDQIDVGNYIDVPAFGSADIKNYSFCGIKKQDGDYYSADFTPPLHTSTSYEDDLSLSFDLTESASYVIIATGICRSNNTSRNMGTKIVINGSSYSEMISRDVTAGVGRPYGMIERVTLNAGTNTIKFQVKNYLTNQLVQLIASKIIAIKETNLGNIITASDSSTSTTTSASYTNKLNLTDSADNKRYLILSSAVGSIASTTQSIGIRTTVNGVTIGETLNEGIVTFGGNNEVSHFSMRVMTLVDSIDANIDFYSSSGATASLSDCIILAIPLSEDKVSILGKTKILGKTSIL